MTDQPTPERFKAEMPQIPGVAGQGVRRASGSGVALRLLAVLVAVVVVGFFSARWLLKPKPVEAPRPEPTPQIEVPAPAADASAAAPHASAEEPGVATVAEMTKPWSSKDFYFRSGITGENVPAVLVRLPSGSASQPSGYWAFSLKAVYGNCQLEYITDLAKLKTDYGFRAAKHAMVGNPCSRTVFDPTKMANLPGNVWVRGAIVQGSDLRPPLGIEVQVKGKDILAVSMER